VSSGECESSLWICLFRNRERRSVAQSNHNAYQFHLENATTCETCLLSIRYSVVSIGVILLTRSFHSMRPISLLPNLEDSVLSRHSTSPSNQCLHALHLAFFCFIGFWLLPFIYIIIFGTELRCLRYEADIVRFGLVNDSGQNREMLHQFRRGTRVKRQLAERTG